MTTIRQKILKAQNATARAVSAAGMPLENPEAMQKLEGEAWRASKAWQEVALMAGGDPPGALQMARGVYNE